MFVIGEIYRRRDLHALYGGQQQGGISTPASYPFILIFTASTGEQYGYNDGWQVDGTFLYTGEGQIGDMTFTRGNRAIRDHLAAGKAIHLFEYARMGHVCYVGELLYRTHKVIKGPDLNGVIRDVIVFELAMKQT